MSEEIRVITKAQYEEYMELKKQDKTTQTKRWKPEVGRDYYAILSHGCIDFYVWNKDIIDNGHYKLGNCFKSEEEARKELDRRLAEKELLDLCDWEGGDQYNLLYHFGTNTFDSVYSLNFIQSPYRFASKKSCQNAIKQLGAEKLKSIFRID